MVVDWRAPISAPFYRATAVDPLGVASVAASRSTTATSPPTSTSISTIPTSGEVAGGIPDPVLAEIGAARSGEMREIVATIQAEQDIVIRSDIDQALIVQGGPGTGQDRGRAAPCGVPAVRASRPARSRRRARRRTEPGVPRLHRQRAPVARRAKPSASARRSNCASRGSRSPAPTMPSSARWKGSADRLAELETAGARAIRPPDDDIVVPIGARTPRDRGALSSPSGCDGAKSGVGPDQPAAGAAARRSPSRSCARRSGGEDRWSEAGPLKSAINKCLADAEAGDASSTATSRVRGASDAAWTRRRPVPRRRGQHAAQRDAVHLRPRDRRRGAGSVRGGAAGDRPAQSRPDR